MKNKPVVPKVLRPLGGSQYVLICDHATNWMPVEMEGLGLSRQDLGRHIAWDIGAAGVTEVLSELLDAPAIFSPASRLVVDCNRHVGAADQMLEVSDGTVVAGNKKLTAAQKKARVEEWYEPYHEAIEGVLRGRETRGMVTKVVSVHSMTPSLDGVVRPWPIALSSDGERGFTERVLERLRAQGDLQVGDNEPYSMDPKVDFSVPEHAVKRGLEYVQVEFRQDEVAWKMGQLRWAQRFAEALG